MQMTRETIPMRVTASGAQQSIHVFRFTGEPGKNVYIQANIHGPEIAGIGAAHDLIRILRQQKTIHGSITVIPSVNPVGLDTKFGTYQVGYADPNETVVGNFNRIYQLLVSDKAAGEKVGLEDFVASHLDSDLETITRDFKAALRQAVIAFQQSREKYGLRHGVKLACTIQEMAIEADCLIDLHTASVAQYHHFTFKECLAAARYFGIRHIVQLDETFSGVLDEAFLQPWLRLQQAYAKAGREIDFTDFDKEAFTLEFGDADSINRSDMQTDAERIVNYLRAKGVLEGEAIDPEGAFYICHTDDYKRYYAPTGGLILWNKQVGEEVQAGEVIAAILQAYQETEVPVVAVESGVMNNISKSQVVHEGMTLCSVLTNIQTLG